MDQRFDQRTIPVPFPPYAASFSNSLLEPQLGTSLEVGVYHRLEIVPGGHGADVQLAAYELRMENEIDFDLETLGYVNVGRSRHRGVEAGLRLTGPLSTFAFFNYTLQAVTAGSGPFRGNQLKAVPRDFVSAGIGVATADGWSGALMFTAADGIMLDDENTLALPGFARVDARLARPVLGVRLFTEVFNLLDREYSVTGFRDPAGSDVVYYYPAAGRMLRLGLSTAP